MTTQIPGRRQPWLLAAICAATLALTACGGGDDAPAASNSGSGNNGAGQGDTGSGTPTPDKPALSALDACNALNGVSIAASSLALATGGATVTGATLIAENASGNALGEYCQVRGAIAPVDPASPNINFAVNLPTQWNGKGIQFGGGGFDGTLIDGTETVRFALPDDPAPLARGYATWGDDSGHQSTSITDGRFATNDEALTNYGGDTLKKTHDVAIALITQRYGKALTKAYFLGTSTGGRDALSYIQRWPADYDGVIANEPALNYTGTRLSNVALGRALYLNGGTGWLNINKTLLVQKAAMDACDTLDGVADRVVSNVEGCRVGALQVLQSLRCAGGTDTGDTCLSDAQIATVKTIEQPLQLNYPLANGVTVAGGYNILEGALVAGPFTSRDLGTRPVPGNPATTADANMYLTGDQWVKYFVTRNATFDALTFDPASPGSWTSRVQTVSALTDATNPDLSAFLGKGGRLILLHGLADEVISPNSTIAWYKAVIGRVGQTAVDQGIRFYTVPGMGHGTGSFLPAWNSLTALENWVELGAAPGTRTVMDTNAGTYGRTRPLCLYPSWPKYKGTGSADAAVNYTCEGASGIVQSCLNMPSTPTTWKGGNTDGEELSVRIDPVTLQYTVTIDASLQRAANTAITGQLVSQGGCTYGSDENGAQFTLGGGGLLSAGVRAASGATFRPLIAFQNVSADYTAVADIYNVNGIQTAVANGAVSTVNASARLRSSAATWQTCAANATGGYIVYDANCTNTTKGYIVWNATRQAFDYFVGGTIAAANGVLSGSLISGIVNGTPVPLILTRSTTAYGMNVYAKQAASGLLAGAADGAYRVQATDGAQVAADLSGTTIVRNGVSGTLTYNTPVPGVIGATGGVVASYLYGSGLLTGTSTGKLEFGVLH
ncbi:MULTISPECIES: tannase/feruloyl esterase family alpha/beta hydrolase [unclassified Cupriavidus]|uniref:tannase/feruloyl esterase family alpha/beta hydrolase n=1 Tax=unclassified Cupriavidus TaxID=2640874 RepID=UPI0010F882E8|nr:MULTISPECIES: tannase/feruloyl esterase family alpha/beta hydrolase [unclassified Cupriavidus]MWL90199.1 tannase/feruloyl esterase family alpha/beta hydrolase [Cupriavidus sp. SW-Y-13]